MVAAEKTSSPISILYVEDSGETRDLVSAALSARFPGVDLQVAADGVSGLELFQRRHPDLVITDLKLPVADGSPLGNAIRALDPEAIIVASTINCDAGCRAGEARAPKSRPLRQPDCARLLAIVDAYLALIGSQKLLRAKNDHISQLCVAVEQSPSAVVITDVNGTIEYANPKFTELTGYLAEEVVGRNPRLLKSGTTPKEAYQELWRTITAGKVWRGQFRNRKKSGELYWESASISPVRDRTGAITHFVAVKEDVTESRRLNDELRLAHDLLERRVMERTLLFQTLYEANQAIIRAKDLTTLFQDICRIVIEHGRFRMAWIGVAEEESGLVRPVAASGSCTSYLDGLRVSSLDQPDGCGPVGRAMRGEGPVVCNDFLHDPRTASWHDRAGACGFRSAASFALKRFGKAIGAMTVYAGEPDYFQQHYVDLFKQLAADISFALENMERERQHREASLELERSREELKEAQRVAGVGSWQYDLKSGVINWSEEMYRIHGFNRHSPIPSFSEHHRIFAPESIEKLHAAVEQTIQTGEPYQLDLELLRPDGKARWITARGEALYDGNGAVAMLRGTSFDITKRRQLEAELIQAKRLEAIGQLAGGLAHEVRNPLNAILSVSEALFKEGGVRNNPAYQPYIEHIRTQVKRLAHLMNDLLELGKPIPAAHLQPVALFEVCEEAIKLLELSGAAKGYRLNLERKPDQDFPKVLADGIKLQQVLTNLLENALQHSPKGSEVSLRLCEPDLRTTGEGMAVLCISDSGSGIPDDKIGRVFEPFYSGRAGGTGLGLALVRHFIRNMGGTVSLRNNTPEAGCTAEIRIPLAARES
jgi:PAS domain S-box-containing protein